MIRRGDEKIEKTKSPEELAKEYTKGKWLYILAEEDLFPKLVEMGNRPTAVDIFQKKRIIQALAVLLVGLIASVFLGKIVLIASLLLPILVYKGRYKTVKGMYRNWKFERHLQFTKFMRLLIPYLKQSDGDVALYSIFNRILQRTEKQEDRASLYKLMAEMSDRPNDVQPFIDFAERSSGSDMSVLFMSTVYDFQQNTKDASVIDELGQIASEELMEGIDEIMEYKLKRFTFFPTKIVMSSFILVVGYAIAVLLHSVKDFQF